MNISNIAKSFSIFVWMFCIVQQLNAQKRDVYDRPLQAERSHDYDAIHYHIKLRFDEDTKSFWGENTIRLSPLRNNFKSCVLDAETFEVTSIVDEESQSLPFEQTNGKLIVHLSRNYGFEDTLSFTVLYFGENVDVDPEKSGMRKGFDVGFDFKAETPDNPRLISTLSWPEGARHWFPCYDHPNDKVTNELIVTVRNDYQVLSNGRLVNVSQDKKNKTKTFHWSQELPHSTYLFVLVAGPYQVIKDALGTLPINYWVYKKDVKDAMRSFRKTPEIIAFFNKEYRFEYPWVKYDQVTIPSALGGMENTNTTTLRQSTIHDERAEQDFSSHGLVAHEAAHQWWGDLVTMRDWSQAWINESFATYGEYLFSRHDLGEEEGTVNLLNKKDAYLREARTRYIRPIVFDRWNYPNDMFDAHLYSKGAVVLNMMRFVLGDEPFRRAMTHFLHKHAFEPVDTYDLMKAIKEATGQNIDWFFEQWLFSPGHPVFDISYTWNQSIKKVELRVIQTQDTTQKVPIFKTPVNIAIVTPAGKTTKKLWLKRREEHFELDVSQKPLLVRFDEGNYLLKEWTFKKSVDELLYQLRHDDVIGRSWATTELSKIHDNARVEAALIETVSHEPFWYVRQKAVEAISMFRKEEHTSFFKDKCLDEKSKVRIAALKVLGDLQNPELVDFLRERFEKEDSYLAQAQALRSIGNLGDSAAKEFLQKASKMNSPMDVVKTAADWALDHIGK